MEKSTAINDLGLTVGEYGLMTAHREENVDKKDVLENLLSGVSSAAVDLNIPVVFLAHPRTQKRLKEFGLNEWAQSLPNLTIREPAGYLDFIRLLKGAKIFFTDSGGGQQEACIHHCPCVTTRNTSEWPDTIKVGANRLAGNDPELIRSQAKMAIAQDNNWDIPFGDGTAAKQIVEACVEALESPPRIGIQPDEMQELKTAL